VTRAPEIRVGMVIWLLVLAVAAGAVVVVVVQNWDLWW
jgi:hypothetical protein